MRGIAIRLFVVHIVHCNCGVAADIPIWRPIRNASDSTNSHPETEAAVSQVEAFGILLKCASCLQSFQNTLHMFVKIVQSQ